MPVIDEKVRKQVRTALAAVFAEMRRMVKPSGKILLAELTQDGFALVAAFTNRKAESIPSAR